MNMSTGKQVELFIEKLGCDPSPKSFFLVVSTSWKNSMNASKWQHIIPLSQMDVDGKCRWNDWTENHDMLSQQKKSLGRTWSWKQQQFDGRSSSTGTGKTCRTCCRVRPSPDLMEIEVFSDFWLSSTESKLINNQFFWNNFPTKKTEFRQSAQESVNWNIRQSVPKHRPMDMFSAGAARGSIRRPAMTG